MKWISALRIGLRVGDESKITVVYGQDPQGEGFFWSCLEHDCKVLSDTDTGLGTEKTETAAHVRGERHLLRHIQRGDTDAVLIKYNLKGKAASHG